MRNKPAEYRVFYAVSRPAKHKGLTLVELLVAITVLAIIAVLGWRGLDSIARARIGLNSELEQMRGMQLTFAQLQTDCAHLADSAVLPNRMPLLVKQNRLTLVRTVFFDNQPSRLQVITYQIKDGALLRHESVATRDLRELDMLWQAANDIGTGQAVALQSGVEALTMRLWINGNWRNEDDANALTMPAGMGSNAPVATGLEVISKLQGRKGNLHKIFLLGAV